MQHALAPAQPSDADGNGNWVTVFGFPQGYQDGVLRHLRDRGEVLEWVYSGTNYVAVRFKGAEAVAEAVGLSGSVLPADGMLGGQLHDRSQAGGGELALSQAERPDEMDVARKTAESRKIAATAANPGRGLSRSIGRFLSELLDITDLSPSD
ncbi:hypothetical protein T484DRAFT_2620471 [Baffinella frigidus]|nr:hypothetical protein T484DRAFT_2620471 [Cryptophyta sp. CCMP2293]